MIIKEEMGEILGYTVYRYNIPAKEVTLKLFIKWLISLPISFGYELSYLVRLSRKVNNFKRK